MKKVCIIDDDPIFVFGTKKIMQMTDFCSNFLIYNNGQKALTALTEIIESGIGPPDVILLDLNMPVMDGWEFLERFIAIPNNKKILIFIVTSSIDQADLEKAHLFQKASNYIVKPVTNEALMEMTGIIASEL